MIATLIVAAVLAIGVFGYGYTVGYNRAEGSNGTTLGSRRLCADGEPKESN